VSIRPRTAALAIDLALKATLVALLVFAAARQDLPQFHGKSMTGRGIGYPLAALVVPVGWWLLSRRRPTRFAMAVDILVVLPFVIDMAGNAANLYDSVSWWDDLNHFVNWAILVTGFGILLLATDLDRWPLFGLAVGFGATTAILWEPVEYVTFIRHSPELKGAYHDTLGDLALGPLDSAVAGAGVAWLGRREVRA
jgi:hypothetical protein